MTLDRTEQTAIGHLTTEGVDPRHAEIDRMSVAELAATFNQADQEVATAVERALPQIALAIEATAARMAAGGRLVYVGAGTPGRLGYLDASELLPTFGAPPDQVFAVIAGGPSALVSPVEGAEDDREAGEAVIDEARIGPLDTVLGIASSGRTPFVVSAVERARARGALTIGLTCNSGTELSRTAEHPIEVLVGPEVIGGSTRLKAGTAQKLVLNMISSVVMVRLGKTYGNLMVDVLVTNDKLRERAIGIIMTITGTTRDEAAAGLERNGLSVKQTIVAVRLGLGPDEAAAVLAQHDGRLRAALGEQV